MDGYIERLSHCLEAYLRYMISDKMVEWCNNTNNHSSLNITPFETLYSYKLPQFTLNQHFDLVQQLI